MTDDAREIQSIVGSFAEIERQLTLERAKSRHWKANHADMVRRCAYLSERPDLPVDRIPEANRVRALLAEKDAALRGMLDYIDGKLSMNDCRRAYEAALAAIGDGDGDG